MHIVTFYSFKGGVGRTMALVNTAAYLRSKGRKVLVVDFDLEAPGASTYALFRQETKPGIVDYVSHYIQTGVAPDVTEYIANCGPENGPGRLWLMSAGLQDSTYAIRFNSIDWQRLYREQDGFLMFEDLKAQWRERLQPDYVLIDSRTGHTDVGGICTRQLPDAVVALFIPNEQNLMGLQKVIKDIRHEAGTVRQRSIHIHFVPSNIPELDDEEGIVQGALELAGHLLSYDESAAIIHHYGSLSLLSQSIFVQDRPGTRLAKEYVTLGDAVIRQNVQDKEGALAYLHRLEYSFGLAQAPVATITSRSSEMIEERLQFIASAHPQDGEILSQMASVRERLGQWQSALSLLTAAIQAGYKTASVLTRRAMVYRILARFEDAVADFRDVLLSESAKSFDLYVAVSALAQFDPDSLKEIASAPGLRSLNDAERLALLKEAMVNRSALSSVEGIVREIAQSKTDHEIGKDAARTLELLLIGQSRFREAMETIAPDRIELLANPNIADIFNYAMAEWGESGTPPVDLFQRIVKLNSNTGSSANYAQCLAVAAYFAKNVESAWNWLKISRTNIKLNPVHTFSCWRYLEASPVEFENDLDEIFRLLDGEKIRPTFMLNQKTHPLH